MRTSISNLRLLGDQVIVKCLGTADRQGSIWIPLSAQEFRKIHQSGGDYLHRGEVLATGPGDKLVCFVCRDRDCRTATYRLADRLWKTSDKVTQVAANPKCRRCQGDTTRHQREGYPEKKRAEMPVKVGDIVLYERRREAILQPQRFPSLDLEDENLIILLAEQHILAVLEPAAAVLTEEEAVAA